jgi:hypothetical protein
MKDEKRALSGFVVLIEDGKILAPESASQVGLSLEWLQGRVGGHIEMPFRYASRHRQGVELTMVCNENGKLDLVKYRPNFVVRFVDAEGALIGTDVIRGTVLFVGTDTATGVDIPLTAEEADDIRLEEGAPEFLSLIKDPRDVDDFVWVIIRSLPTLVVRLGK